MSYELIVWPVDRAVTVKEAVDEIGKFSAGWQLGFGHDERLDAFVAAMRERYPDLHENEEHRPFEFDVMRKHVFVAVPDSAALQVTQVVADAAWSAGVAVFDPQRELVALPAPFGDAPMPLDGIEAHLGVDDPLANAPAAEPVADPGGAA
jgi:hypothetical protein